MGIYRERIVQLWSRIDLAATVLWLANCQIMLLTWRKGMFVGRDRQGNSYYRACSPRPLVHPKASRVSSPSSERRWVLYQGEPDASKVPAEWHGWLHHTVPVPLENSECRQSWQRDHQPNLSGTAQAYLPPGHPLQGRSRPPATGDYQPWRPGQIKITR